VLLLGCACSFIFTFRTHLNLLGIDLGVATSPEKGVTIADLTQQDDDYASAMEKKNAKNKPVAGDAAGADAGEESLLPSVKRTPVAGENDDGDSDVNTNVDGEQTNEIIDEEAPAKDRQRMNVLLLYPDDWRWDSLGAENPIIQTPFLDSLAQQGMRFRQNAVTTSICWQSRATLFSGQWASRHRSFKLKCPHFTKGEKWNQTWVGMLRKDGYHTGHIGKWQYHNNDMPKRWDFHHGFEGRHWYNHDRKMFTGDELASHSALEFLQQRPKDKPFSLSIAFYPPKPVGSSRDPGAQWKPRNETRAMYDNVTIPEPYNHTDSYSRLPSYLHTSKTGAERRWYERYRSPEHYQEAMKNVYALITQVDHACKEIVDELKKQDIYNNTLIIFTTDNGMFHGAHGLAGKWYPYQESIRVPLIIYDPRMPRDKMGVVDDSFTLNVDLAETILGAAGLKPHKLMQGRDMSDLYLPKIKDGKSVLERKPWRDEFFYEFTIWDENFIPSSNALVRKKWKFIHWYTKDAFQLFDLSSDPLELYDVKDDPANADIVRDMKFRLFQLQDGLKEPDIGCKYDNYDFIQPIPETLAESANATIAGKGTVKF